MKLTHSIFLLLLFCPLSVQAHSVHMSFGRFVVQDSTLSGKLVMVIDDYQAALMSEHEDRVALTKAERVAWTLAFLEQHVAMFVDDVPLKLKIVGQGLQKSSIWFEIVFVAPKDITTFVFENRLLFDQFQNQQNITTFLFGDQQAHLVFTRDRAKQRVFE